MSEKEKAQAFAQDMQPVMEKRIHAEDYNNAVKTITFNKHVKTVPLGGVLVDGYINNDSSLSFEFNLDYGDKTSEGSYTFSKELQKKLGNTDKEPAKIESNSAGYSKNTNNRIMNKNGHSNDLNLT
ncbi:DUF1433 domain-containing protein [Listeria fleischmannii]|uniref:DUF1433 domain-containing protein n=1 Tax=Listeria fleischmannii TaxID=1069827 RepID=UPI00162408AB|nr:DUF1433 domain-containing protein [Listeria fleischmannii]MBC1420050.1 DUF1433 domain-containing protein [Listeria fleischmannii]